MKTPNLQPGSFTRRSFIKTAVLATPFLASGCAHFASGKKSSADFVTVRNGRFELRGQPHNYIGANIWFGCYLSTAKLPGGRQRLVRELDHLQALGVTNLRLLAGSESHPYVNTLQRGITRAPHDYVADLLVGLDFTLAEMAKRNLRLPFLENLDAPALQTSCARRESSTHAPQALEMLNGSLSNDLADAFASRLEKEADGDPDRIVERAFRLALGRLPLPDERQKSIDFLREQSLPEFALALFNLNGFLYVP